MEPATPSSVMGDSEAAIQLGGAEEDAGISFLSLDRIDIGDFLISVYLPASYIRKPKNRHERRKNRALVRDDVRRRLPLAPIGAEFNVTLSYSS